MITLSAFTFIRNAVYLQYPIVESINSLLPIVDEYVVNICTPDEDSTEDLIRSNITSPKLKIIYSEWDFESRYGGEELSRQTNIALDYCAGDWAIYLQADECIHEKDWTCIEQSVRAADKMVEVQGISVPYYHFFGTFWTQQVGNHWYDEEIRIIRNDGSVHSWGDAQSFSLDGICEGHKTYWNQGHLLHFKTEDRPELIPRIYHYGWVRPPRVMSMKTTALDRLWHPDTELDPKAATKDFDYGNLTDLETWEQDIQLHPQVMHDRILNWKGK